MVLKKWSFITQFSSPITHHSVFITHNSSLKTPHLVWHHHSFVITQYFSIICRPHTCTSCSFYFFFFFFFLQPSVAKFTEPSEKKKLKKKTKHTEPRKKKRKKKRMKLRPNSEKKKRERRRTEERISEEKKKKKKDQTQEMPTDAVYLRKCHWIMDDQFWKQLKSFFFFRLHHSDFWVIESPKQSDGVQTKFFSWVPPILDDEWWVLDHITQNTLHPNNTLVWESQRLVNL